MREGLAYAWSITEIRATIVLVAVVGTLVYNFPTFLTLMASETFHGGAGLAGFLMAVLGVGTVIGALAAAHARRPTSRTVVTAAATARGRVDRRGRVVPTQFAFEVALVPVGALAVFFGSIGERAHADLVCAAAPRARHGDLHAAHARHHRRRRPVHRLGLPALDAANGARSRGLATSCANDRRVAARRARLRDDTFAVDR